MIYNPGTITYGSLEKWFTSVQYIYRSVETEVSDIPVDYGLVIGISSLLDMLPQPELY